jgi:DNA-binding LacI/PurR family transcriptional regulator
MTQRRPTSFDIAALAGVSQPTVSRALSGSPSVSEATRRRVLEAAEQLNYKVDKNASGLRRQQAKTLALLFFEELPNNGAINPFYLSLLGPMVRRCADRGYDLLISFQQMSHNWHAEYAESRKADGLILLGYGDYTAYRGKLDTLLQSGTHFVRWGAVMADQPGVSIGSDDQQGGRLITEHLLAQGRRRIAFLGNASGYSPEVFGRYLGYQEALAAAGIAVDPLLQVDAVTNEQSGHDAMCTLLDRAVTFDAVFGVSDLIAIGAMRALIDRGIAVPDDVAVAGFDDIHMASNVSPALTTVAQDTRRAGRLLVDALINQIEGKPAASTKLPTRLIVRHSSVTSTRPPAG